LQFDEIHFDKRRHLFHSSNLPAIPKAKWQSRVGTTVRRTLAPGATCFEINPQKRFNRINTKNPRDLVRLMQITTPSHICFQIKFLLSLPFWPSFFQEGVAIQALGDAWNLLESTKGAALSSNQGPIWSSWRFAISGRLLTPLNWRYHFGDLVRDAWIYLAQGVLLPLRSSLRMIFHLHFSRFSPSFASKPKVTENEIVFTCRFLR
jgi:hypothetical protein